MNKRSAGYLFCDLDERNHFQARHGGVVHQIQETEDECVVCDRSLLGLKEGIETRIQS